jgi:NitT/TauT family transport system substrate-binding protein
MGVDAEKDVTVLQIGNSAARLASLRAGNIDGTILTVEQAFVAKQQGMNVLADVRKLGVEYPFSDVVTTRRFVNENEDIVRRFVKSIVEGIHFYKTNKARSIDIMTKYMRLDDRKIVEVGYEDVREAYQRKPYPTVKGIELALEELSARNPNAKKAKPEQFYDPRFIKELDESGFIDRLYR